MLRRTSSRSRTTSWPATRARPPVGFASVQSMLIVVVLPAPFGPRNPNTSPGSTSKLTPRTASKSSNFLRSSSTSIIPHEIYSTWKFPETVRFSDGSRGHRPARAEEAADARADRARGHEAVPEAGVRRGHRRRGGGRRRRLGEDRLQLLPRQRGPRIPGGRRALGRVARRDPRTAAGGVGGGAFQARDARLPGRGSKRRGCRDRGAAPFGHAKRGAAGQAVPVVGGGGGAA